MAETDKLDSDIAAPEELVAEESHNEADQQSADESQAEKLQLTVEVERRSACERHINVTVAREDIDRYADREFSELMPTAQVPGFRPGRAPRKLVESRFRKEVGDRVKSQLLLDVLSQVNEDEDLSAISEPDFDYDAVEIPDEGPLTFEFDLEVRPEFELPKWKGLKLKKPVREISSEDIDRTLERVLASRGRLIPREGAAEAGDYLTTNLTFKHDDREISSAKEEVIRIRPVLSFRDGTIEEFDKLMAGVKAGETRQGEAKLSDDAPNSALRGQTVTAVFEVLEVKRLELPELTPELLEELGGFELEADLRDAIKDQLQRQLEYKQHQEARQQITDVLTEAADWELPPEMLRRQSHRELQRAVMELQRSGFGEDDIRAYENELRRNSTARTAQALKEHFILERIAEEEELDAEEDDYTREITLIAYQSGESPRRVRARLEKSGSMDVLRNQIIERKVIEKILAEAEFTEVPFEFEATQAEAIDQAAGGHDSDIPEAKPGGGEAAEGGKPAAGPEHE